MRGFEKEVDELKILKCSQPTDIGLAGLGGADHDSPDFWVSLKSLKKVTDMFHTMYSSYLKFNILNIYIFPRVILAIDSIYSVNFPKSCCGGASG